LIAKLIVPGENGTEPDPEKDWGCAWQPPPYVPLSVVVPDCGDTDTTCAVGPDVNDLVVYGGLKYAGGDATECVCGGICAAVNVVGPPSAPGETVNVVAPKGCGVGENTVLKACAEVTTVFEVLTNRKVKSLYVVILVQLIGAEAC